MGVKSKGVSNIRTLASVRGSGVHSSERHVHQFQIASLELERTRRIQERDTTRRRLQSVEERIAGLDEQIRQHQEALGIPVLRPTSTQATPAATEPRAESKSEPKTEPKAGAPVQRHKLRY